MAERTSKRGRPFALTEEEIGDAVVELGLDGFSVRALAIRLGVSEKTLYNYASGRNGLVALGMERAMRCSPAAPAVTWTAGTSWRALLEQVAEQAWRFMNAVPGVGNLIAQGVHSRAEAEFSSRAGAALMARGFTATEAVHTLAMVFDLVAVAFVNGQRMDVPAAGEDEAERDRVVVRLRPDDGADPAERELFDAMRQAMWEPTKQVLDRRLGVVLDGIEVSRGAAPTPAGDTVRT